MEKKTRQRFSDAEKAAILRRGGCNTLNGKSVHFQGVQDTEQEREIILLTNHLDFGATTISAIYKDRWQIELFFKALKQNLKIKTFVGTSENALRIQIWTALIALLLLKWLHHLSQTQWSFANLASMLRLNLFTYRDLREWLDNPFTTPPITPDSGQLVLNLG